MNDDNKTIPEALTGTYLLCVALLLITCRDMQIQQHKPSATRWIKSDDDHITSFRCCLHLINEFLTYTNISERLTEEKVRSLILSDPGKAYDALNLLHLKIRGKDFNSRTEFNH